MILCLFALQRVLSRNADMIDLSRCIADIVLFHQYFVPGYCTARTI